MLRRIQLGNRRRLLENVIEKEKDLFVSLNECNKKKIFRKKRERDRELAIYEFKAHLPVVQTLQTLQTKMNGMRLQNDNRH